MAAATPRRADADATPAAPGAEDLAYSRGFLKQQPAEWVVAYLLGDEARDEARPAQISLFAPQSVRRPVLMPQVNPGSLCSCGESD